MYSSRIETSIIHSNHLNASSTRSGTKRTYRVQDKESNRTAARMSAEIIRILKVWRCCGLFPRTFESGVGPNERHKVTRIGPASFTLIGMSGILFIIRIILCLIYFRKHVGYSQYDGISFLSDKAWNILWIVCIIVFCTAITLNNRNIAKSLRSLQVLSACLGTHREISSIDSQQAICVLLVILYIIQIWSYTKRAVVTSLDFITSCIINSGPITFLFLVASFYRTVAFLYIKIISKSGLLLRERTKKIESNSKSVTPTLNFKNTRVPPRYHTSVTNSNRTFIHKYDQEIENNLRVDRLLLNILMILKDLDDCLRLFIDAVSSAIVANLINSSFGITGALYFSLRELPKMVTDLMLLSTSSLLTLIFYVNAGTQVTCQVSIFNLS